MKFKPGKSGNPRGRPRGIVDQRTRFRAAIEKHADELIALTIQRARDGDGMALRLLLDRIIPPLRAIEPQVDQPTELLIKRTIVHVHRAIETHNDEST